MLKVEHLVKTYPNGTQALKDVSFEVQDGEFLAVIGLSGSGKSTLLRCINRLIDPTSGRILWNGMDVTAASGAELRKIRRQIGMVFQQFNLVKRSSVLTNVLAGRLGYVNPAKSLFNYFPNADKQRALNNLELMGLREKAYIRADSLSGGQQQRVGIARALMQDPKLVLADEPVASLDPRMAHQVLELLCRLAEDDGVSLLCTLHQPELAEQYFPRVLEMSAGRLSDDRSVGAAAATRQQFPSDLRVVHA